MIQDELKRARPDYGFLMEESGAEDGRSPHNRWIVDPLDGTTNFLHGMPHWSISIALEQHGEMTAGIIYDPSRNELFSGREGQRRLSQRPADAGLRAAGHDAWR